MLATGLYSEEKSCQFIELICRGKIRLDKIPLSRLFIRHGFTGEIIEKCVPARSARGHDAASPCGSLLKPISKSDSPKGSFIHCNSSSHSFERKLISYSRSSGATHGASESGCCARSPISHAKSGQYTAFPFEQDRGLSLALSHNIRNIRKTECTHHCVGLGSTGSLSWSSWLLVVSQNSSISGTFLVVANRAGLTHRLA